jgi:hypothetical protein
MAVAAPQMAVTSRAGAGVAVLLLFSSIAYAQSQPEHCQPSLPILHSDKGKSFTAEAYGIANWHISSNGRRLPYAVHVWKGKAGDRTAYLTFDEIPGTSGPNYHLDRKLQRIPAKIDWTAKRDFAFDPRVVIRSGPLADEWTVTNCPAR